MHATQFTSRKVGAIILGRLLQPCRSSNNTPIALAEVPDKKEARDAI